MKYVFTGRVWVFGDNISTDLLRPGMSQFGKVPKEEMKYYCLIANRPNWSRMVKIGDIIVAGKNFGCGSSRPATSNLIDLGISCAVVESYSALFFRNSINLGFPILECKGIKNFFNEGEIAKINIRTGEIKNLNNNRSISTSPIYPYLLKIISVGGLIPLLKEEIEEKVKNEN